MLERMFTGRLVAFLCRLYRLFPLLHFPDNIFLKNRVQRILPLAIGLTPRLHIDESLPTWYRAQEADDRVVQIACGRNAL